MIRNALALIGILTLGNLALLAGCALVTKLFPPRRTAEVVPLNVRRVDCPHCPHCRPVPAPRSTAASAAPRLAAVPTTKHTAQRS